MKRLRGLRAPSPMLKLPTAIGFDHVPRAMNARTQSTYERLCEAIAAQSGLIVLHMGKPDERGILPKGVYVSKEGYRIVGAWQVFGTREGKSIPAEGIWVAYRIEDIEVVDKPLPEFGLEAPEPWVPPLGARVECRTPH